MSTSRLMLFLAEKVLLGTKHSSLFCRSFIVNEESLYIVITT